MPTFAGRYLTEPSDLAAFCTEAAIIAICDASGGPEARGVQTFAALTPDELAAIVAVVDEMIAPAESLLDSYARRRGYVTPLDPVDATARDVVAQLVWISLRQHAGRLTGEAAETERKGVRRGDLRDIAEGKLLLTAARASTPAPGGHIYSIDSAHQRDKTGATVRLSRKTLRGF